MPESPHGFAFVLNVRSLQGADSFRLDGHEIRRANADEVSEIRNTIPKLVPGPAAGNMPATAFWEYSWPGGGNPLPNHEWCYFVIAFVGSQLRDVQAAFDLSPIEIEIGFESARLSLADQPSHGLSAHITRIFHVLDHAHYREDFFVDLGAGDVAAAEAILGQLRSVEQTSPVRTMLTQLSHLKALPHSSPLRFLGYFALLESLLTHQPKPDDRYDSITRQVKHKLALLDHRWSPSVDYSAFKGANSGTIWSQMYAYRSRIAHGAPTDFNKDFRVLRTPGHALSLIKETTKAVMRQLLIEPQLLQDLRNC